MKINTNDPLMTSIELPISEFDAQVLLMALEELPDDVDGMKEVMKKHNYIKTDQIDQVEQIANSSLLFKHMLLHRISAQLLKDDPFPKFVFDNFDSDYEEV